VANIFSESRENLLGNGFQEIFQSEIS
jgi:hypothetical protein